MNKQMLVELCRRGWEIGSHTRTHRSLVSLSDTELNEEFEQSRKDLESMTGYQVTNLSYPYTALNNKVMTCAARHYISARTVSAFPPLRLNSLAPEHRMKLEAMWSCEAPLTIPIHIAPQVVKRAMDRVLPKGRSQLNRELQSDSKAGLSAKIVEKWVEKAAAKKKWLILCFHDISTVKRRSRYSVSIGEFRNIIKAVVERIEVIAIRDAFS